MIRLVEGQVNLEDVQALVDGVDQTKLAREEMDGADAAVADAVATVAEFVLNVAGGEHGFAAIAERGFVEGASEAALAIGQLPGYSWFRSKSLSWLPVEDSVATNQTPQKREGIS